MSIRLDPRRLQALKRMAADAGTRPGDLVRSWVEERIDAERVGESGLSLEARVAALEERLASLAPGAASTEAPAVDTEPVPAAPSEAAQAAGSDEGRTQVPEAGEAGPEPEPEPASEPEPAAEAPRTRRRVSAAPSAKVALHDEMIAVIGERGPMTAGELAAAIAERGRYAPPRSGKPLDAAMVSQRASNPTYRSRFVRREGRIGLADASE